jgi:hypothetical protein
MDTRKGTVTVNDPAAAKDGPAKSFPYDATFDWTYVHLATWFLLAVFHIPQDIIDVCCIFLSSRRSTQAMVFTETAQPIVDSVLEGYNGTIFAYGQTGTVRTSHTRLAINPLFEFGFMTVHCIHLSIFVT